MLQKFFTNSVVIVPKKCQTHRFHEHIHCGVNCTTSKKFLVGL